MELDKSWREWAPSNDSKNDASSGFSTLETCTLTGEDFESRSCIYVPEPIVAKKRQPVSLDEELLLVPAMDANGKFGQASTPKTTFPSSSNPSATAYWSPLRNLILPNSSVSGTRHSINLKNFIEIRRFDFRVDSFKTYPLVPSIGSKTQCRPFGPPSDDPQSMALSRSSVDKVEPPNDSSVAKVSLTSFVIRSRVSWEPSLRRSPESYIDNFRQCEFLNINSR